MNKKLMALFEEKVPDFLEAFRELNEAGFFEVFSVQIDRLAGSYYQTVQLNFSGHLPGRKGEYASEGVIPFLNAEEVINNLRPSFQDGEFRINVFHCETKYEDLPRHNRGGETVTGSNGRKVSGRLSLGLQKIRVKKVKEEK